MSFTQNTFEAGDIRKLKVELKTRPASLSRSALSREIGKDWSMDPDLIERWLTIAESFSDEVIDLFEAGKVKKIVLTEIARSDFTNPAYKDFLARKSVEENLSRAEIKEIREYVQKGRHPLEAIDILRGRRPEKPITKNDELSIDRIIRELEKDGFAFRQRFEILKAMGKIQILQNGQLKDRLAYSIAAMKVIADDMKRFVDEAWESVPKEAQEAVAAQFSSEHEVVVEEEETETPRLALPAPVVEGSDATDVVEEGGIGSAT